MPSEVEEVRTRVRRFSVAGPTVMPFELLSPEEQARIQDEARRHVVGLFDALPREVRAAIADCPRQVPPALLHTLGLTVHRHGIPTAVSEVVGFARAVAPEWVPFEPRKRRRRKW